MPYTTSVADVSGCEMVEVGGFLSPQGNDFWGVEVILNMRRKIQQMQGEVNEFMEYVKSEMTRGIDDWEQRLSTAMVKSTSTDLVRVNPPAAGTAAPKKHAR